MTILHQIYDTVVAAKGPILKRDFLRDFGYHNWAAAKRAGLLAEDRGRFVVLAANAQRPVERPSSSSVFDQTLIELLSLGPLSYSEIERRLESNYSRLSRSARRLSIIIEKEGRVTTWRLPIARRPESPRRRRPV